MHHGPKPGKTRHGLEAGGPYFGLHEIALAQIESMGTFLI